MKITKVLIRIIIMWLIAFLVLLLGFYFVYTEGKDTMTLDDKILHAENKLINSLNTESTMRPNESLSSNISFYLPKGFVSKSQPGSNNAILAHNRSQFFLNVNDVSNTQLKEFKEERKHINPTNLIIYEKEYINQNEVAYLLIEVPDSNIKSLDEIEKDTTIRITTIINNSRMVVEVKFSNMKAAIDYSNLILNSIVVKEYEN